MRRVAILGSTGSIGRSALSVVDAHPDRLAVVALVAGENTALLADQVLRYRPSIVGVARPETLPDLARRLRDGGASPTLLAGPEGLVAAATHAHADIVLCASSGTAGLDAALAALGAGKTLALANKEVLVMAGRLMIDAAHRHGARILPVDSEHNAIHQCLHERPRAEVRRLILTASGGPFRTLDEAGLARATADDALQHPTWQMGRKITIDSATLMNKGLEVIEAHWLFDQPPSAIDVVIHPQSIVHSLVELCDGSVIAQLGVPDMRLPIQYAFSYPERWGRTTKALDVAGLGVLEFGPPDPRRFPCLRLAYEALEHGGAWSIAVNAANELAVEAFLAGRIAFPDIPRVIADTVEATDAACGTPADLEAVRAADAWARSFSADRIRTLPSD